MFLACTELSTECFKCQNLYLSKSNLRIVNKIEESLTNWTISKITKCFKKCSHGHQKTINIVYKCYQTEYLFAGEFAIDMLNGIGLQGQAVRRPLNVYLAKQEKKVPTKNVSLNQCDMGG